MHNFFFLNYKFWKASLFKSSYKACPELPPEKTKTFHFVF